MKVKLNYQINDYYEASKIMYWERNKGVVKLALLICAVLLFISFTSFWVGWLFPIDKDSTYPLQLVKWIGPWLILASFFAGYYFTITRLGVSKWYKEWEKDNNNMTIEFTPNEIKTKSKISTSNNKWSVFKKALLSNSYLMLILPTNFYFLIPKRSFKEDNDWSKLIKLVKSKVIDFKQI